MHRLLWAFEVLEPMSPLILTRQPKTNPLIIILQQKSGNVNVKSANYMDEK
jgi:hypothetical protein